MLPQDRGCADRDPTNQGGAGPRCGLSLPSHLTVVPELASTSLLAARLTLPTTINLRLATCSCVYCSILCLLPNHHLPTRVPTHLLRPFRSPSCEQILCNTPRTPRPLPRVLPLPPRQEKQQRPSQRRASCSESTPRARRGHRLSSERERESGRVGGGCDCTSALKTLRVQIAEKYIRSSRLNNGSADNVDAHYCLVHGGNRMHVDLRINCISKDKWHTNKRTIKRNGQRELAFIVSWSDGRETLPLVSGRS